jgi:peptide/nickel transport system substrate-binding protein
LARKFLVVGAVVVAAAAIFLVLRLRREGTTPTPQQSSAPASVEEITVAYPEEPASLNPYLYEGDSNSTRDLLRPVLPTLLSINDGMHYGPALATTVPSGKDIKSNPFSVTFRLDPKAQWSDGVPITAEDVKFTWDVIRNSSLAIADRSAYKRLVEILVSDPVGLTLVFDKPYPAWRDLFSAGDFILPKHVLEGKDIATALNDGVPISGGPFQIDSITKGLEIVYKANPKWWGRGPAARRIRAWFVPDIETAIQLLKAKRVDVVMSTSQVGLKRRLGKLDGVTVQSQYGAAWWELGFNNERAGPKEAGFRQAVALGLDRAGFTEALMKEDGRPLQSLDPGTGSANAFARWEPNVQKAQNLLGGASFVRGKDGTFSKSGKNRFSISGPAENEIVGLLEKSIQTGLARSGISIEPVNPRGQLFYGTTRRNGEFDVALWERRGSPDLALSAFYASSNIPPNGVNYSRLQSADVDAAIAANESSAVFKRAVMDQMMNQLAETLPALPLFEVKVYIGYRDGLVGLRPNASVDGPFWNVAEWGAAR